MGEGTHGHNDVNVARAEERDSEKEKYGGLGAVVQSASICRVLITFDPFLGLDQCIAVYETLSTENLTSPKTVLGSFDPLLV